MAGPFLVAGVRHTQRNSIRHDSVTSVMPHDRHSRMIMHRGGLRYKWDTLPNENLKFEDLDESRIHWAIRQALELGRLKDGAYTRDPIAILEKFKVLKNGVYTNAAAVLFGDRKSVV